MQLAMREFEREVGFDGSRLKMGIGIHFGHLELGVVGEAYRWDSSIIADAVNTASRVEGLTKTFAAEILVTDAVIDALEEPNEYRYRRLGMVSVKGRSKKVSLYELLDSLPEEILDERFRGRERFEEALKAYEGHQDDEAHALFEELLQSCPKDRAASFYLERLHRRTRTAHSDRSVYLR
jgi:two-component system sensor histidine kinase ChiS